MTVGDIVSGEEGPALPGRERDGTKEGRTGGGVERIRSSMSRRLSSSAIQESSSSSSSSPTGGASEGTAFALRHAWISGPAGGDDSLSSQMLVREDSEERSESDKMCCLRAEMLPSFEEARRCQSGASTDLDGRSVVRKTL